MFLRTRPSLLVSFALTSALGLAGALPACTADRPARPVSGSGDGGVGDAGDAGSGSGDLGPSPRDLGAPDLAVPAPDLTPTADTGRCRLDSDCAPGTYCDTRTGTCWFDCRLPSDCRDARLTCENGRCVPRTGCATDRECDPPTTVCEGGTCQPGCLTTGCTGDQPCDPGTGRCTAVVPECVADRDCRPPETICERGLCLSGCLQLGCADDLVCDRTRGRCVAPDPPECDGDGDCPAGEGCNLATGQCERRLEDLPDGLDSETSAQCRSGLCAGLTVAGTPHQVCARLCCSEFDCPAGSGCLYFFGVQLCLPSRIFPAGYDFSADVGESCGRTGDSCRSGLCYQQEDRCLQTCCRDSDCGAAPCSWSPVGNTARQFCDGYGLLGGGPGSFCSGMPFECMSGICLPDPSSPYGGVCTAACCSDADCWDDLVCGQVGGPGGAIAYGCLPLPRGELAYGEPCGGIDDGDRCLSGLCMEGSCTQVCCQDRDCPLGSRCLALDNGEGGSIRACTRIP
mgnify:CR=1 FL=1